MAPADDLLRGAFLHRLRRPADPDGSTLVLLHGSGVDETSLMPLAAAIAPRAALLAVRGRVVQDGGPRWYRRITPIRFDQADIAREADAFAAFIAEVIPRYRLDPAQVVFLGYSNGANLLSSVMLRQPGLVRRAVLLRPMPVLDETPSVDLRGVHVLVVAGQADETYAAFAPPLVALLGERGAETVSITLSCGHGFGDDDVECVRKWLAQLRRTGPETAAPRRPATVSNARRIGYAAHATVRGDLAGMQITIIVEFEAGEARGDALHALLTDHARRTLEEEPGCLRFEILQQLDAQGAAIEGRFIANELYASERAVRAHEENSRLPRLRESIAPLLKSRRLIMARATQPLISEEGIKPEDLTAANDD